VEKKSPTAFFSYYFGERTSQYWIVPLLAIWLGLSACASQTTPPGATIISGSLLAPEGFGGSYTLLQWKDGLSISIVDDLRVSKTW
jgi:hypothetical protein